MTLIQRVASNLLTGKVATSSSIYPTYIPSYGNDGLIDGIIAHTLVDASPFAWWQVDLVSI